MTPRSFKFSFELEKKHGYPIVVFMFNKVKIIRKLVMVEENKERWYGK